jgi:uncharacterized protein (TIRG00374 family)
MKRRTAIALARTAFGVGLIVWLVQSGAIDWASLAHLAGAWELALAALALCVLVVVLVSWRLRLLLLAQGFDLPLSTAVRLSMIGAFFSSLLPGSHGGDLARMLLAAGPHPGHRAEIATTVLLDRALGAFSLIALPILAFGVVAASPGPSARATGPLVAYAVAAVLVAAVVVAGALSATVQRATLRALGPLRLDAHAARVFRTLHAFRGAGGTVAGALLLSLGIQALAVVTFMVLMEATGGRPVSAGVALVVPFGMLANALPVTPGGLGVGELAFEVLFRSVGASGGAETILAWRIVTTGIDLVGGAFVVLGRTRVAIAGRPDRPLEEAEPARPASL